MEYIIVTKFILNVYHFIVNSDTLFRQFLLHKSSSNTLLIKRKFLLSYARVKRSTASCAVECTHFYKSVAVCCSLCGLICSWLAICQTDAIWTLRGSVTVSFASV